MVSVYSILLRKILIAALNILVITLGMVFTVALCALLSYIFPLLWFPSIMGLLLGLAVLVAAILAVRRKTRQLDIEYEAAKWLAKRSTQRSNSRRRLRATIRQCLLWLPSVIAAFVLFFYPVASHIVHPGERFLTHYRVPIPWTWELRLRQRDSDGFSYVHASLDSEGSRRFGMTPHWLRDTPANVYFASRIWRPETELSYEKLQRANTTNVSRLELRAGDSPIICWQYMFNRGLDWGIWGSEAPWQVVCETPSYVTDRDFYGSFIGRKEDLPAFYGVLTKVKSVD